MGEAQNSSTTLWSLKGNGLGPFTKQAFPPGIDPFFREPRTFEVSLRFWHGEANQLGLKDKYFVDSSKMPGPGGF